ncbi:tryptophan-rich sensory protein [Spirosoma sp. 209]|uniref:tryptophan-rich sensory protein n=1 Tax=Spirosoma sp. 209 TaxID=1955701 RepID=UPI00098D6F3E|nr:tryptophan-rich sensory protein [Spirosoma sp. 209]
MKTNSVSPLGTAAFVIGSMITTFFFSGARRSKRTQLFDEQQRVLDQNVVTPANRTFTLVWPVIYTGTAGLLIHQALPAQHTNPRYQQARPWWLASYGLNLLFGVFFSRPDTVSRVGYNLTTIAMLPTALGLHRSLRIGREDVPQPERLLRRSVSLYAGWLTAATVVTTANLALEAGYRVSPAKAVRWAAAVIPLTAGLGLFVARRLNDPYYLLPLISAFSGIAVKQYEKATRVAVVAGACALLTTGVMVQAIRERRSSQSTKEWGELATQEALPEGQPVAAIPVSPAS